VNTSKKFVKPAMLWQTIRQEASKLVESEPMLASYFHDSSYPQSKIKVVILP